MAIRYRATWRYLLHFMREDSGQENKDLPAEKGESFMLQASLVGGGGG